MHLVQATCLAHDGSKSLEAVERAALLAVQAQKIWESSKGAERSCNFKTGSSGVDFSPMMMIGLPPISPASCSAIAAAVTML